ncbi:hypothetical protein [Hyella patelloides]|uniref:hypothetical protein n=1 Tax=Hyella patelloides TaxID=1982969 RepID=UPI0011A5A281|nr:hypothetical protein [Hyella patelloides]
MSSLLQVLRLVGLSNSNPRALQNQLNNTLWAIVYLLRSHCASPMARSLFESFLSKRETCGKQGIPDCGVDS